MKDKFTALICKVSGNRFLNVLRDSFVLVASLTLIAGFAIMISSVFIDPNGIIFGSSGLGLGEMIFGSEKEFLASGFAQMLVQGQNIFNFFSKGAMSINALLIVVIFSYNVSRKYFSDNREHMVSVMYALAAFFICLPWDFNYTSAKGIEVDINGIINSNFLGQQGIFFGLIVAGSATFIFNKLSKLNISIKMPDSVPPAVAQSFESLVPGMLTLFVFIIATVISNTFAGESLPEFILTTLQAPALAISKTAAFALVSQITWPLFQWLGIHPTAIWGAIFGMTWDIAGNENVLGVAKHLYTTMFMNYCSGNICFSTSIIDIIFLKTKTK